MSFISAMAKSPNRTTPLKTNNVYFGNKTIGTSKETTFVGTLYLSKEQWERGMALSLKMSRLNAW